MSDLRDRVIDQDVRLAPFVGRPLVGALEYFPGGHALAVTDDVDRDPAVLTVPVTEAREATAKLADDEVLLRNWTERRGVPESLEAQGYVQLTGTTVSVGPFGLEALVARVL